MLLKSWFSLLQMKLKFVKNDIYALTFSVLSIFLFNSVLPSQFSILNSAGFSLNSQFAVRFPHFFLTLHNFFPIRICVDSFFVLIAVCIIVQLWHVCFTAFIRFKLLENWALMVHCSVFPQLLLCLELLLYSRRSWDPLCSQD